MDDIIWKMPFAMMAKTIALTFEAHGKRCMGHRDRRATQKAKEMAEEYIKGLQNGS
jgi:hypothetical protein